MPSSERFYVGSLSDGTATVWLTSDMTADGLPAKLDVSGDDGFADDYGATVTQAADGTVHVQGVALNQASIAFEIKLLFCPADLKAALETLLAPTRHTSATVRVQLASVKREIDVQVRANGNNWLATGAFSGGIIRDVVLRLISVGPGA